jgi:hypothetical protein
MGIPEKRGATCVAFPYPEWIKDYFFMTAEKELNKINKKPIIGEVTNFAAVSSGANSSSAAGEQDFTQNQSSPINQETMFGEGSIGKIRFAGLAYMLQEEKIINLQDNAKDFFASKEMNDFLEKKYPEKSVELQQEIGKFFSGESEKATLADLRVRFYCNPINYFSSYKLRDTLR